MAQSKLIKRNRFSVKANQRGVSPQEFASMVRLHPDEYNDSVKRYVNIMDNDLDEYSVGGSVLSGAASGAAAGTPIAPPWGTVVGGVVGAVGGLFSGLKSNRAERAQRRLQQKQLQEMKDSAMREERLGAYDAEEQMNYAPVFAYGGLYGMNKNITDPRRGIMRKFKDAKRKGIIPSDMSYSEFLKDYKEESSTVAGSKQSRSKEYAYGGMSQEELPQGLANVEVEGGESVQMPSGESFDVDGPSHAEGGVPMNIPEGGRVYSDRLKFPGTGKTFSDHNSEISKKINKFEEVIDDPQATPIEKQTAKRMLEKLRGKQEEVFDMQQELNGDFTGDNAQEMEMGGTVSRLPKASGGIRMKPGNYFTEGFSNIAGLTNMQYKMAGITPKKETRMVKAQDLARNQFDPSAFTGKAAVDKLGPMKTFSKTPPNEAFNWNKAGGIANGLLQAAPAIYNIAQGIFGKADTLDPEKFNNPYEGAAINAMRNRKFNIDPLLEANRINYATANRNLSTAAKTRGELLSGYGANAYGKSSADMTAWATKNNEENKYKGELANMYAQLGNSRASNMLAIAEFNARSRAAKSNMLGTGITQLGALGQRYELNKNRRRMDLAQLDALRNRNPNITLNDALEQIERGEG